MNSVFRKLLWGALLLIALTLLIVYFNLAAYTSRSAKEGVQTRLELIASVLAGELDRADPAGIEAWARDSALQARARVRCWQRRDRCSAPLREPRQESLPPTGPALEPRERSRTPTPTLPLGHAPIS